MSDDFQQEAEVHGEHLQEEEMVQEEDQHHQTLMQLLEIFKVK
jgi:hypothetical protein